MANIGLVLLLELSLYGQETAARLAASIVHAFVGHFNEVRRQEAVDENVANMWRMVRTHTC